MIKCIICGLEYNENEPHGHSLTPQGDLLQKMLLIQRNFQTDHKYGPPIFECAAAIMSEGGELWAASGGKWWKHYFENLKPRGQYMEQEEIQYYLRILEFEAKEHLIEESIDILHFLLMTWLKLGLSAEEVYRVYSQKMGINVQRQKDKY